jgi:hypothetical protein
MRAAFLILSATLASLPAQDANTPQVVASRRNLWSLQPITNPAPPPSDSSWPRNPIDLFILDRLAKENLTPSPEADQRTLVRRLHFSLTGLPPSPDALAFSPEETATALLPSRAAAEHLARLWLDAVRYSDYVIRSFAEDKPFHTFLLEQLAGDELVPGSPVSPQEQDALTATGYLRLGPWDNSAKLFNEQHKALAAHRADLTETTAAVFLGMTMSCCRCHDHKTDPLTVEDHYRFRAHFASVAFADDRPLNLAGELAAIRSRNAPGEARIASAEKEKESLTKKAAEAKSEPDKKKLAALDELIAAERSRLSPLTFGFITKPHPSPDPIHVLPQGDPDHPGPPASPGIPSVFASHPYHTATASARSDLARWLASPQNPLTARVTVNRLWQHLFGTGLVSTAHDFGHSGSPPSHPELLDWLASDFIAHGWSTRHTIARIIASATWRQASACSQGHQEAAARDRQNRFLWRFSPRRHTAEMLRDSLLSVSGLLQPCPGGPPVWPSLPDHILKANPAFLDDNAEKTKGWYPSPPEQQLVRSIYLVQKRSVRLPFMETFDQPDNFAACDRRQSSTVAPQALTLLNGELPTLAARALAQRLTAACGNDRPALINRAFQLTLQRLPSPEESAIANRIPDDRLAPELARILINTNEFAYTE